MKKSLFSVILILSFSFSLSAQIAATWKGGKPGRTTDWNCPDNWTQGRVPDEFTQVIIPFGASYYPVIQSAPAPIDALLIEGGASLTIREGAKLTILCETGIFDGITALGKIWNDGTLNIGEPVQQNTAFLKHVNGNGIVISLSTGVYSLARRR
jgi:hypothetical protein